MLMLSGQQSVQMLRACLHMGRLWRRTGLPLCRVSGQADRLPACHWARLAGSLPPRYSKARHRPYISCHIISISVMDLLTHPLTDTSQHRQLFLDLYD